MLSVIKEEEISLFSERSEWEHLSEFEDMISDSSDNEYCHRNFRKTVYIYFCHIFQFRKAKWIGEEWSVTKTIIWRGSSYFQPNI